MARYCNGSGKIKIGLMKWQRASCSNKAKIYCVKCGTHWCRRCAPSDCCKGTDGAY
jgi:hypothetical protein